MDAGLRTYKCLTDRETREDLIVSNLAFVKHILGRLLVDLPPSVDYENLEAAGILGLVEAANRYSKEHGVEFKSFAYQRIRGAILDELRRNCPLPQKVLQDWAKIRSVIQSKSRNLNSQEIARVSGLSIDDVEKCLVSIRMTRPETWSEELEFRASHAESKNASSESVDKEKALADAIEKLADRSRTVITLYYQENLTLRQIGTVLGLSESRVSRLLAQAELELKSLVQT